jgi:hypothetical protein
MHNQDLLALINTCTYLPALADTCCPQSCHYILLHVLAHTCQYLPILTVLTEPVYIVYLPEFQTLLVLTCQPLARGCTRLGNPGQPWATPGNSYRKTLMNDEADGKSLALIGHFPDPDRQNTYRNV